MLSHEMWHPPTMATEDRQPHFPFGEAPEPRPEDEPVRNPVLLALPLAAAIGMFGISFGVLAASEPAFGGLAAIVMSATTFAGSAQFAVLSVLSAGGNAVAAIVAAVLLNLRYLPIGVSVAPSMSPACSVASSPRSWWWTSRGRSPRGVVDGSTSAR